MSADPNFAALGITVTPAPIVKPPVKTPVRPDPPPASPLKGAALEDPGWWTPEGRRGWATSLALHSVLLLVMGLWYFAPSVSKVPVIVGKLAGSEMGVDDGLNLLGGLNTEIELAASPEPVPEPTLTPVIPLDLNLDAAKTEQTAGVGGSNVRTAGGGFDTSNPGAGNGDGFGLARFGEGGELIRGVEVKVGDPQFTLLWDTEVDLDLHVVEPGGKQIFWESPKGKRGGELDVDNTKGFGPENIYWLKTDEATGQSVKGFGPPGDYQWWVEYWGGFGGVPKPTKWKVRIKHGGKVTVVSGRLRALNEKSRVHSLKVEPDKDHVDGSKETALKKP